LLWRRICAATAGKTVQQNIIVGANPGGSGIAGKYRRQKLARDLIEMIALNRIAKPQVKHYNHFAHLHVS
jgi:hypothetical protein